MNRAWDRMWRGPGLTIQIESEPMWHLHVTFEATTHEMLNFEKEILLTLF